jgi:hypothetical protein
MLISWSVKMMNAFLVAFSFGSVFFLFVLAVGAVGAEDFATSYVVLTPQGRAPIPGVSGPIQAKVASNLAMSLLFTLNKGAGYAAGPVTATTDAMGRIEKLVKLRQTCTFFYASSSTVLRVTCTSRRRELEAGGANARSDDTENPMGWEGASQTLDGTSAHRRLATCSSCVSLVSASFTTRMKALCGTAAARKIPASFPWAKSAASALCGMAAKLGKPATLAYNTCRCQCLDNADCPSSVCSGGVCLDQKLSAGQRCYDYDDNDCLNGSCARKSYIPTETITICCPSGRRVYSPYASDTFCTGIQGTGYKCDSNDLCASGVCSAGKCLAKKLEPGEPCPDPYDHADCANGSCARGSYPMGDPVCCPSGNYTFLGAEHEFYCTAILETGDRCDSYTNDMCISGVCSEGVCLYEKKFNGGLCLDLDDNDCLSGFCALGAYPDGFPVCCSEYGYVYSPSQDAKYCTGILENGAECDTNEICSTGVRSGGFCASRMWYGESCPDREHSDCVIPACARGSYPSGEPICCFSGAYVYSPTSDDLFCTWIQEIGEFCDSNEICLSGECSQGRCIEAT